MQTRDYLRTIWRRKWIILIITVVTMAAAYFGSSLMTPNYSATTVVRIAQAQDSPTSFYDINYAERIINTYVYLLKSHPFLEEVIRRLSLNVTPENLSRMIHVEAVANSELLRITVKTPEPQASMQIANMLGTLVVEQGQRIYAGPGKSAPEVLQDQLTAAQVSLQQDKASLQAALEANTSQLEVQAIQDLSDRIRLQEQTYATLLEEYDGARIREALLANSVNVVEQAIVPQIPSSPRPDLNLVLGALLGLAGGLTVGFIVDSFDSRVDSSTDLESAVDVPVLTAVPVIPDNYGAGRHLPLLSINDPGPAEESFRTLKNIVCPRNIDAHTKPLTLLITSTESRAGRSTVLANLAALIAQDGLRVVAVDTDLRHPSLHRVFGVSGKTGVSNALSNPSSLLGSLQPTDIQGLSVIASGPLLNHPARLLNAARLEELAKSLTGKVDVILFDSPPMQAFADALALAPIMDGVLLVVARKQADAYTVQKAIQQLDQAGATVLGMVLNKARPDKASRRARHTTKEEQQVDTDSGQALPASSGKRNTSDKELSAVNTKG